MISVVEAVKKIDMLCNAAEAGIRNGTTAA